ncbi:GntR family transcriptional regulator [Companilactobacillus mishanensis]|uniref:GntR family transcriptional regulator n=1 Tax=Companilactobacillus mishanensis TaxID=2486008 RepID=A0A5P0ZHZ1_9LACO|nr:GntR family transcriptional regulator [Companilactobacillus mishanensis]MQS45217.1 GntR family transcriptional regulator [Companilactobacillus mishanensis]MQS52691.1 GntR family transcriptional regulator [Companilactobacillus mishanensis]
MEFDDKIPIYYQIKNYLYHQIVTGELDPGEKLPAVRQLAVDVTANVNTVQRALTEMINEQIIEPQRGKGNFVTIDVDKIKQLKDKLVKEQLTIAYQELHDLQLSDNEILEELRKFMKNRGVENE